MPGSANHDNPCPGMTLNMVVKPKTLEPGVAVRPRCKSDFFWGWLGVDQLGIFLLKN
jgi:hypothetical protein